jgi:hypothetical protein
MPAPRTTSDVERPLIDRDRRITVNRRNQDKSDSLSRTQAAAQAGSFVGRGRNLPRAGGGNRTNGRGQPARRQNLLERARQRIRESRAQRARKRANRARRRAG